MSACLHTDRVDAYVDGELSPEETAVFERHAGGCAACAAEVALARRVTTLLRDAACEPCPEPVLDAALARIARIERRGADRAPLRLLRPRHPFRTAVLALAASAVVAALAIGPMLRPTPPPSAAEVAQARSDVEYALSLVARSGERTGHLLRDDVLGPHVADAAVNPILEALGVSH